MLFSKNYYILLTCVKTREVVGLNILSMRDSWLSNIKGDILSGITVALALIPEAISFAIICGVNPMVGLYASFCIAVVIAFFGGRPGMISAATGAMAVVMVSLVKHHGIEYMFVATILTGIIQFILGRFKIGQLINFVPHSVVLGFVNSLAILIFIAQIPHFKGASWVMYAMVVGTLVIVYILPRFTKAIPAPLVAIVVMTLIYIVSGVELRTVGDMGNIIKRFPIFHLPTVPISIETIKIIMPYSVTLSVVGLLESLMTAKIVDEMTESKGDMNREVSGQGIANVVAGFFGGMAGCAMIGQSVINIKSGGKTRLSTLVAGLFLLFLIIVLGDVVKIVPMAVLVGVMIMVSISTFEWHSLGDMRKLPITCSIEMIVTMGVVVATHNLALGVVIGIALSAVFFAWKIMNIKVNEKIIDFDGKEYMIYRVQGQLYFASANHFVDAFDYLADHDEIIIDFKRAHVWDHSAVVCIEKVKDKFKKNNKKVSIVGLNKESDKVVTSLKGK